MNRRSFLLGLLSSPASAALLPKAGDWVEGVRGIATISPSMLTLEDYCERILHPFIVKIILSPEYQQAQHDLIAYGECVFDPNKAAAEARLDRPGPAWQDGKAGRDQIG